MGKPGARECDAISRFLVEGENEDEETRSSGSGKDKWLTLSTSTGAFRPARPAFDDQPVELWSPVCEHDTLVP